jgi:putative membrane protein
MNLRTGKTGVCVAITFVLGLSAQASAQSGAPANAPPSGRAAPSGAPSVGAPSGPGAAGTAAPSDTAAVLGKLHHANQMEIQMGKMAQEKGQAKEVKAFGKTLVTDHTAMDKKVMSLAKQQKIDLPTSMPPMNDPNMTKLQGATGAEFDRAFAQAMVADHQRDVEEAKAAHSSATDPKLKTLLGAAIPVLEKHRETAQKLTNSLGASASAGAAK